MVGRYVISKLIFIYGWLFMLEKDDLLLSIVDLECVYLRIKKNRYVLSLLYLIIDCFFLVWVVSCK